MKNSPRFLAAAFLGLAAIAPLELSAEAPALPERLPTGKLDVNTKLVSYGGKPTLTWNVEYPDHPFEKDKIIDDVTMSVSIYGVAFEAGPGNEVPVSARMRVGDQWFDLFSGTGSDVDPSQVVLEKFVPAGTELELAATGEGSDERSSAGEHIVVLKDGETPPSYTPAYNQGTVESFLSAYVENGKIAIGKDDVIYLAELYSETPGEAVYDMQDIVVHVKFVKTQKTVPANN